MRSLPLARAHVGMYMSSEVLEDPWGQLVSLEREEEERIPVLGSQFTIGRGKGEIKLLFFFWWVEPLAGPRPLAGAEIHPTLHNNFAS